MKFLIEKPSPLIIRIFLGPKYSPQDPIFKYVSIDSLYKKCYVYFKGELVRNWCFLFNSGVNMNPSIWTVSPEM